MKVYNNLSPATFAAVADEAGRQRLGLAGHHLEALPLETELRRGNFLVAHLEELMYGLFKSPDGDPLLAPPDLTIHKAVALLKRNHAFVVADLITFETMAEQWARPHVVAGYFARPDIEYVAPRWRLNWRGMDYDKRSGSLAPRAAFVARLAKALDEAGIPLVTGTDAPTIPGIVPGFSVHENMDRLVAAGLTPFQALSSATRTPGEYISRTIQDSPPFGEVSPGYRADLILSDSNPFTEIRTLRTPSGVMSHGRWFEGEALGQLLQSVASDYAAVELK
jgi:hypothetical protein